MVEHIVVLWNSAYPAKIFDSLPNTANNRNVIIIVAKSMDTPLRKKALEYMRSCGADISEDPKATVLKYLKVFPKAKLYSDMNYTLGKNQLENAVVVPESLAWIEKEYRIFTPYANVVTKKQVKYVPRQFPKGFPRYNHNHFTEPGKPNYSVSELDPRYGTNWRELLASGLVSPFYVYSKEPEARKGLRWRDFFNQLAYHNVKSVTKAQPLRSSWKSTSVFSASLFRKWCEGKTGFHAVDAAMRCLNATGQISNRSRMLVANFFVKIYNLPWTQGERYFAQTLNDYDPILNMMNWQWSAGCGVDSVIFRVFNPTTQLNKYDESRAFTSKWLSKKELETPEDIVFYMKQRKLYLESY